VISAKRRKIPVFHMEAGNRCFDQRVPEEINRKIVDHLSDINMTLTEHARRYLVAEGIPAETVIKTGSSMQEVLDYHAQDISNSDVLSRLKLTAGEFFIVSAHREENIDSEENFGDFLASMNKLAEHYQKPVIISTHPRTKKKLESLGASGFNALITFMKPLGFFDYIALQKHAFCAISDSGTITEEASILGFPAITIRQAHERPEGMDVGTLIMAGLKSADIINAIDIVTGQRQDNPHGIVIAEDYAVTNVSQKVVRIIVSYVDYIRRTVWKAY
jgi:UDP-N-acetylglucosamine 2-epimerase (non-hydrolysing)